DREESADLESTCAKVVGVQRYGDSAGRDRGENRSGRHVQEDHATRFGDGPGHRPYHTGDMVRERVGDWRLAWRFALVGALAGLLVLTLAQTGLTNGTFNVVLACTLDDAPKGEFSTVAAGVGERGLGYPDHANAIRGVVLRPDPKSTCPQNESDEPAFLLALRIAGGIDSPLQVRGSEASFGKHRIPLVGNQ